MSWFKIGHSTRARRKRSDGGRNGLALAQARGVADHVEFHTVDAAGPLPFSSASFDAIVSNDAMCHIEPRLECFANGTECFVLEVRHCLPMRW
jgi:SAM-dependent methyltransferase